MVARVRNKQTGRKKAPAALLKHSWRKGERKVGRAKGTPDKMTRDMKEALLTAAENKGGKEGLTGFFEKLYDDKPELFVRLLEKLLPFTLADASGKPLRVVVPFPHSVLERCTNEQLDFLEKMYRWTREADSKLLPGPNAGQTIEGEVVEGDAAVYAELINDDDATRH